MRIINNVRSFTKEMFMYITLFLLSLFIINTATVFYAADKAQKKDGNDYVHKLLNVEKIFKTLMEEMRMIAQATNNKDNEIENKLTKATNHCAALVTDLLSQNDTQGMLVFASMVGTSAMIKNLLAKNKVTRQECAKHLLLAVMYGNVDVVKFFITEQKIDILNPKDLKTIPELYAESLASDKAEPALDNIYQMMKARYSNYKEFNCPFSECRRIIDEALAQKAHS